MSSIPITKLYDLLSARVGKETAENLTIYLEDKIKDEVNYKSQMLATKEDLDIVKSDMIKLMFIFWIGQIAATFGFISLFLKK